MSKKNDNLLNLSLDDIKALLIKNKKRLLNEISESKELIRLLGESTHRKLSQDEQDQVNNQLIDVLKTIPSFAIFMLPGGALLLPLVLKFIPNLLPSSFSKDFDEEE